MPSVKSITKTIKDKGIPFAYQKPEGGRADIFSLIDQMDSRMTEEQRYSVMQEQGCCKTDDITAPFRAFGQAHADKPLAEKVALLPELQTGHRAPCHLNADGTLAIYWGMEGGENSCVCRTIRRMPEPKHVSLTYCGCCAGHVRNTYQYALGVKLQLKAIVSSPISSNGKNICSFIFNVIE